MGDLLVALTAFMIGAWQGYEFKTWMTGKFIVWKVTRG